MKIIEPSFKFLRGKVPDGAEILARIAEAGRVCYQSEPTTDDATFVRKLIERGHESVLEHASISVRVICDRGVTHETVRHRIASYSQESTRYCNYSKGKFGSEVPFIDISDGVTACPVTSQLSEETKTLIVLEWWNACKDAERHYMRMIELGASPQIARSVLNSSTKTEIVMTYNVREWRHFFRLRCAPDAHPQMRQIANMLLKGFRECIPVVFDDIEVGPE